MACVAPDRVAEMWPHVVGFFSAATDRCGDWTIETLREQVDTGALLWVVHDGETVRAAAVTRLLKEARQGLTCHIVACGGAGGDWPSRIATLESYAAEEGCRAVRLDGRKGWSRVFPDYGTAWVTLEKRLEHVG